ncbi:site-2 protease family protein [Streptomyces luteolus]|uniref:Site-2 protease family protein n=1 Tax=Streptomyces luteolus TaxID=3043615 RepID=A0ABT6STD5_9ACTN|nr:site-2 protease family protein [Streptomyces sp. B-S-A12]MDI3418875.1 site-2 protease family protein [Streptomyces sp. B-S-A12]
MDESGQPRSRTGGAASGTDESTKHAEQSADLAAPATDTENHTGGDPAAGTPPDTGTDTDTDTGTGSGTGTDTGTGAGTGTGTASDVTSDAATDKGAPESSVEPKPDADPKPEPAPKPKSPAPKPKPPAPKPKPPAPKPKPPAPKPDRPRGGIVMGRILGVPIHVAPSWFLVAALITWVFGAQLDRILPELGALRYLVSLFFAVAFYASVLVHEIAHTIVALRYKLPVRRIQLQFFGGVSEIEKESETPGREFMLAFVGPLLSLVLTAVFYAGMYVVEPGTVPGVLMAGLMISNLIVAIFNLLPGLPLDGGRMLRAVVWKITGRPMAGTVAAAWVGRALAITVLIGLPLLTQSGILGGAPRSVGVETVTDALLAAILAAIIWTGAGNSLRMARLREHLPQLQARTLTRRAVPVTSDTPLSEALRRANAAGARALVVVDSEGDATAVVREAAIVGVPEHRRPWVAVSSLAQDLTDGMRVSAELAGEDLIDTLRATPATEYLVVEPTGEIYGVLSTADVERAFVKAMARSD